MWDSSMYEKGLKKRREVLGDRYVDDALQSADEFTMTFQNLVTELAWGYAWSGDALDTRSKCILTLGILAATGRFQELSIYVKGALAAGVGVQELKEILTHVTVYCGTPTGRQAFLAVGEALHHR